MERRRKYSDLLLQLHLALVLPTELHSSQNRPFTKAIKQKKKNAAPSDFFRCTRKTRSYWLHYFETELNLIMKIPTDVKDIKAIREFLTTIRSQVCGMATIA